MRSRHLGGNRGYLLPIFSLTSRGAHILLQRIETGPIRRPTRGKNEYVVTPDLDAANNRSASYSTQPLSRLDHEWRVQSSRLPQVVRGSARHRQSELEAVHSSIARLQPAPLHVQLCDHGDSAVDAAQ